MTATSNQQRGTVLLAVVCFFANLTSSASGETGQEIAARAFKSTVLLVMQDSSGQTLSLGSGFIVAEGLVATNLHVIEGGTRGYAKVVGAKAKYDIAGVRAVDPGRDLALLQADIRGGPALRLGDSEDVQVGEPVYAVGNPRGLEGTFSQGIVSSKREIGLDKLLQITAPISPGSSGGPVLNTKGEVIGVSVATYQGGQNLNFAIPSNYVAALQQNVGPVKALPVAVRTKDKSITENLGGGLAGGVVGENLTWEYTALQNGKYAISLRNKLRDNVQDVYCLVVFYDGENKPIDVDVVNYRGLIPAGLAKRVTSQVDGSVQRLTSERGQMTPNTKVEFRILDFEISE